MEILPSILTDSPQELENRLKELEELDLTVHVDFMDGQFVESKSFTPDALPDRIKEVPWVAHLMVQDPLNWSPPLYMKHCQRIFWHAEVLSDGTQLPRSTPEVEHGLALRLETPIASIEPYLATLKSVLLLSIDRPGYQGELFQDEVYGKIQTLKAKHSHLKVTVDGGVNLEHMKPLTKLGVDRVSVGSAFWQFGDPKAVLSAFRKATL